MNTKPYKASGRNKRRAGFAASVLDFYAKAISSEVSSYEENVTDLLTDLLHFCIQNDVNFVDCLEQSETHMASERSGRE